MVPQPILEAIGALLATAGETDRRFELTLLASGGNNRVYSVKTDSVRYVAKWYYREAGGRDRASAEFEFLSHLWSCGIRNVQRPVARDACNGVALYEYVAGRCIGPGDLSPALVEQAAQLFAAMNEPSIRASGRHLPHASDACFTIREHIASVDRRIERLAHIESGSPTGHEALEFVRQLASSWAQTRRCLLEDVESDCDVLPEPWRGLSPSDFGFHNAVLLPGGEACFLDFEYAGWDDPAKMVGDFFAHPGVPVPANYFESFTTVALAPFAEREKLLERVRRLRPVSRIRWCCIMLNEFLPQVAERRRFAYPDMDIGECQRIQLAKARALFERADRQ